MGRLILRKDIKDPNKKDFWKCSAQFLKYTFASCTNQLAHLFKYTELCPTRKAGRTG
jgi:hypothetical protein